MHQYLFHIGDFPIRMYGLIMCLSIMLATATAWFLARQDGRWHDHVPDMGLYCGLAVIVGARLCTTSSTGFNNGAPTMIGQHWA